MTASKATHEVADDFNKLPLDQQMGIVVCALKGMARGESQEAKDALGSMCQDAINADLKGAAMGAFIAIKSMKEVTRAKAN